MIHYVGSKLHVDGVSVDALAAKYGTPFWLYSESQLKADYAAVAAAVSFMPCEIAYAMKANGNLALLKKLRELGAGVDVVSGGELLRAIKAGYAPENIVYSGVGKTRDELELAIAKGIRSLNVESEYELETIASIARARRKIVRVALRINPNVDAKTHPYIATGLHDTKFGLEMGEAERIAKQIRKRREITLRGIASHIGSQIGDLEAVREATRLTAEFAIKAKKSGHKSLDTIDLGGGWPIDYGDNPDCPSASDFGPAIRAGLKDVGIPLRQKHWRLIIEPGRALVARAGCLVTRVLHVKTQVAKKFAVVDGSMTELIRPALYDSFHTVLVARRDEGEPQERYDVVGPVCETGDFLAVERRLPLLRASDLLVITAAGAYGSSMSSQYNARPFAPEILVEGKKSRVIRKRQPIQDLWKYETA